MNLSFTDQFIIADPLVSGESSSGMLAFPWLAWDGNSLLMSYHDGPDGPGGVTRLKSSDDFGLTWSPGVVIWDESRSTGGNISVCSRGDYIVTSQGYNGSVENGVYVKRSLDHSAHWLPGAFVTNSSGTGGSTYTSTGAFEVSPGRLLWPVYGPDAGHTGDNPKLLLSVDYGVTWNSLGMMAALSGGIGMNEVTLNVLPDGALVALARCTDMNARRMTSGDGGTTWSTPAIVFGGCNSRIDWVKTVSGRCVATYRDSSTSCAMLVYSDDDMLTVSTPVMLHGPNKRTSYSSLVEIYPGVLFAALGEIDAGEATGRIMGRYILDGYAVAPTGETSYLAGREFASGKGSLVGWDSFRRPDNAVGLGSADSGQPWFEFGAGTDWHLSGGIAKNTSVTLPHSVTLNTGNVWGYVEADLMWSGSTSSPLGLVAKRSTVTGHALVAKLEASGTVLKISYFDGAASTDLASAPVSYMAGVWNRWRFLVKGNYARVFIDGALMLSYTLTSGDHTNLDAGTRWGLWGGGTSGVTYQADNVIVSK